jgi:hypothetical protein
MAPGVALAQFAGLSMPCLPAGRRDMPQAEAADGPPPEAVPGHHPDQQGEQQQGLASCWGHCREGRPAQLCT